MMRSQLEWLPPVLVASGAAMLQSCVLVAMAGLFAMGLFYDRMDREPGQRPLQCAIRCVMGGLLALLVAIVLAVMLTTNFWGAWAPTPSTAVPASALLLLCVGIWFAPGKLRAPGSWGGMVPWAATLGVAALLVSHARNDPWVQCVFAGASAIAMVWIGWRLIGAVAPISIRNLTQ